MPSLKPGRLLKEKGKWGFNMRYGELLELFKGLPAFLEESLLEETRSKTGVLVISV
ncbi:hypothetical protein COCNU_scaffold047808G000010 [Cocos nucifera]|nr:hypothetical protein [Cocos nucifera]